MRCSLLVVVSGILATPAATARQPAVGKVGTATVLKAAYAGSKANLMAEAEKMPEADYALKPGTMPEVCTFGQLFGHARPRHSSPCVPP
jgi:hypothetical protein